MHPTNCLNCETMLTADDHYCPNCGQKTDTHRLTILHIAHEFLHQFIHADKGFLGMVADLAVKPGTVAREYVQGKRRKYFSPFTFFILSIGILAFSSHVFKTNERHVEADPRVVAQLPPKAKARYINLIERTNASMEFLNKNLNTVAMIVVPFYALIAWLCYGRRRYNYSEAFVAVMLFQSFVSLAMAVLITPWISKVADQQMLFYVFIGILLFMSTYVGAAQFQFLEFKNRWSIVLTTLTTLVGYLIVFVLIILCVFLYVYGSNTGEVLKVMWQKMVS